MKREAIIGLDIIRFLAASFVVLYHFTFWIWAAPEGTPGRITRGAFDFSPHGFSVGWVGVEIFFVLSGFVIAYSASASSPASFLKARVLRLAPAAWICSTITIAVALAIQDGTTLSILSRYLRSLLFWPMGDWIDGTYWTLGVELAFYGMVWLLLCLNRFSWLEYVGALIALCSTLAWAAYAIWPDTLDGFIGSRYAQLALLTHGCHFILGVALWLCLFDRPTHFRLGLILLCLAGGAAEIYAKNAGGPDQYGLPLSIWIATIIAIILSVRFNSWALRSAGAWIPFIRGLGIATYPLYLLHQLVGAALMYQLYMIGLPQLLAVVISVFAMLAASLLIALWIEPVVRNLLRSGLESLVRSPQPARP